MWTGRLKRGDVPSWYVEVDVFVLLDDGGCESADSTRDRSRVDICSHNTSGHAHGPGPDEQRLACGWACDCDSAGRSQAQGRPRATQGQLTRPGCLGLPAERGRATGDPGCGLDRGLPCTAAQWAPNAHLPYVRRVPAPTHTHSLTLSATLLLAPSASLLVAIEINHIAATSDRIHN